MTTTRAPNHLAEPEQIDDLINHDEKIAEEVRGRFGRFLEDVVNPGALERDRAMNHLSSGNDARGGGDWSGGVHCTRRGRRRRE